MPDRTPDPAAERHHARRRFLHLGLRHAAALGALGLVGARSAHADAATGERRLVMRHTHTGERLDLVYAVGPHYLDDALATLNHFLRDHYSGEPGTMDPTLFDLLHRVRQTLGVSAPFEVISAYRCASTNEDLRRTRGGGVARRSLHLDGRAIDVRLTGVPLARLRDAAWSLQSGGVGHYARDRFVHLDTGAVRRW